MLAKLSKLARLSFNSAEQEVIKADLQKMIQFVKKMDELDTAGTAPLQHMAAARNVWRADLIEGACSKDDALKNSGLHNKDFFMVPKVIKK